jgi:hypothetical protein
MPNADGGGVVAQRHCGVAAPGKMLFCGGEYPFAGVLVWNYRIHHKPTKLLVAHAVPPCAALQVLLWYTLC